MSTRFRRLSDATDVEISVDGRKVRARRGESVAAAMLVAGIDACGVDPAGRPRGPACMMGSCFQCACAIDGVADARACRVRVAADTAIATGPARGAAREAAGPREDSCDVAVVGAGPAGGACALALAAEGLRVALIDDNDAAGGQIWRKRFDAETGGGAWLRGRLDAARGAIDHRKGVEVLGRRADGALLLADRDGRGAVLAAASLVIATGALEVPNVVPGWTAPGVLHLGALQVLAKADGVVPAGAVLLAGAGPLLYVVADDLRALGCEIAAVVDAAPFPDLRTLGALMNAPGLLRQAIGYEWRLRRAGVPILRRRVLDRIDADGGTLVATIRNLSNGEVHARKVAVVGTSLGLRPNVELAGQAGCALAHDPALGGWHATVDGVGETSVPGVYAIGETRGIGGVEAALCDGVIAAATIVERAGRTPSVELARAVAAARARRVRFLRAARALAEWSRPPAREMADDAMLCRCEAVEVHALRRAVELELSGPREAKLASRAGMGFCQGRTCHPAVAQAVGAATAPTFRFPLRPVRADAFAPKVEDQAALRAP
ncbi:MAG: FAD-dependent oxidoreductase [Magnetospirillum sp.]|nr:FAD-dependent oxidoreductase [Magnetospirillum sp.]